MGLGDERTVPGTPAPALLREMDAPGRGTLIDHFVVLDRIGEGAMGVVLSAYDPLLDRKVALKLLRRPAEADAAEGARLLREAQAMAKVNHPNVITIFQVGSYGGSVYLAMELVEGRTLRGWLAETPRPRRAILDAFVLAGRGLAEAHRHGLVHRDFKPENVLVDGEGRVLVTDFGVAALSPAPAATGPRPLGAGVVTLDERLTETGAAVGTPAYMAPEQHLREPVDARADQFSFCVALFEALCGVRPYDAPSADEILQRELAESLAEARAGAKVPGWLRAVLARGLRRDPAARHPDMNALLAALGRDPALRWRRAALAAGGVALLALGVAGAAGLGARGGDTCAAPERALAGVWDGSKKEPIRQAFLATGRKNAEPTAQRVFKVLDDYAVLWARQRGDACRATARGEQSGNLLDLRMSCLDRRLRELGELARVLAATSSARQLDDAIAAATRLSDLDACADSQALLAAVPPPATPAARAEAGRLRGELDRLRALDDAGRYNEARPLVDPIVAAARVLGYPPVLAEALAAAGNARDRLGDYKGAEPLLEEAATAAAAAHDDALAAAVWIDLLIVVGDELRRGDEPPLRAAAEAAVVRAGDTPGWRRQYWGALGRALVSKGRYADAAEHTRRALALATGGTSADLLERAALLNNLGLQLAQQDRDDEARAALEEALALRRRVLGEEHPTIAAVLANLSMLTDDPDPKKLELAREYAERAIAMRSRLLGREHIDTGKSLNNLAIALDRLGRHAEAEKALREAIAIKEKALGPDHPNVGSSWSTLGMALVGQGRYDEARAAWDRTLAVEVPVYGEEHPAVAGAYGDIAGAYMAAGRWEEARPFAEKALVLYEKVFGKDTPRTTEAVLALARIDVRLGRLEAAAPLIARGRASPDEGQQAAALVTGAELAARRGDRAGALADAGRAVTLSAAQRDPLLAADVRARAAVLLYAGDRTRAAAVAQAARETLAGEPGRYHATLAALDAAAGARP